MIKAFVTLSCCIIVFNIWTMNSNEKSDLKEFIINVEHLGNKQHKNVENYSMETLNLLRKIPEQELYTFLVSMRMLQYRNIQNRNEVSDIFQEQLKKKKFAGFSSDILDLLDDISEDILKPCLLLLQGSEREHPSQIAQQPSPAQLEEEPKVIHKIGNFLPHKAYTYATFGITLILVFAQIFPIIMEIYKLAKQ
jgi:Fe2+ transport system protein B